MIHINQLKVPVEKLLGTVPEELLKRGTIGGKEREIIKKQVAERMHLTTKELHSFTVLKKSIDARKKKNLSFVYQVEFSHPEEKKLLRSYRKNDATIVERETRNKKRLPVYQKRNQTVMIVGFGPAGMFAALTLAREGFRVVVLERGMEMEKRSCCVEKFWKEGILNPESNVQFGEGGAGTFSDGKLNTMVRDAEGKNRLVLQTFVTFGAPEEILYLTKPHIGTDRLKEVVVNIREEIRRLGGIILFESRFIGFRTEKNMIREAEYIRQGTVEKMPVDALVLAIGHSARDTFFRLHKEGITMEPKAFAVGVRVEHPQEMIGKNQYGAFWGELPAADYKLTYQTMERRGVYSFCMCPGGYVVNSSSEERRLSINGMSNYLRDGENANSAIVVTVSPDDFPDKDPLAGIAFQRKYEEAAFRAAGGKVPVQLFGDFLTCRISSTFGKYQPQIKGEYGFGNVREILPGFVGDAIAEGMQAFDRRITGFAADDVILSGIESRTSSPVKILRDDFCQANVAGIFPCGEGAGYAGGIMSAAMDGIRVAQKVTQQLSSI